MRGEHFDMPVRTGALRDPGGSLLEEFARGLRKARYAEITVRAAENDQIECANCTQNLAFRY
jgi:hypothetical protein